tara:strand:- start:155 stop:1039 length:885 start_codon:yes stop_codon:yes gene_type:complete
MEPIYDFSAFGVTSAPMTTTTTNTNKFDWGALLNSGASGNIEGGLSMAANAIVPGSGAVLAPILDGLKLDENYNLAKKYGWNSWGASASPESISAEFESITMPEVARLMQDVSTNPQKALSETKIYLETIIALRKYLRKNHSKANSTKQANELMAKKCQNLLDDIVLNAIEKLKSIGCKISTVDYPGNPTFNFAYSHWSSMSLNELRRDQKHIISSFKGYQITASAQLKQKIKELQMQPTQGTPQQNLDFVSGFNSGGSSSNGGQSPKSNDSTIYIVLAALVLMFWKHIKKLIK